MKKTLARCMIAGFLFTSVTGSLFHSLYEWSGKNAFVGLFTPVNESVWEHIKLLFFPLLIFLCFATQKLKKAYPCIGHALSAGLLFGCLSIPVLYYTYTGILGVHFTAADIGIYYLSTLVSFLLALRLAGTCPAKKHIFLIRLCMFLLATAFLVFTYAPPTLPLFTPP